MTYQVNEIFASVQGEGFWTGAPAVFIRLQGCTVGCSWCDSGPLAPQISNGITTNTWGKGGERMSVDHIMARVNSLRMPYRNHYIITGGEPTLYNLDPLIRRLSAQGFVQLETSGQNPLKGTLVPSWVTWSPKENLKFKIAKSLRPFVKETKWVIDGTVTAEMIRTLSLGHVFLMPEGCPPSEERIKETLQLLDSKAFLRFTDRLQYRLGVR